MPRRRRCRSRSGKADLVRPRRTRRFLVDSNVYDQLVVAPERQIPVIDCCEAGAIELLMTHVQVDELMAMPDDSKHGRVLAIPFTQVPTYGMVLGTSRVGLARFGEPELIDAVRSDEGNHVNDALLASTAKYEQAILVTNDRRLSNRAMEIEVEVWDSSRFLGYLDQQR